MAISEIEFEYFNYISSSADVEFVPQLQGEDADRFARLDGVRYRIEWKNEEAAFGFSMWEYDFPNDLSEEEFYRRFGVDRDAARKWMDMIDFAFDVAGLKKERES